MMEIWIIDLTARVYQFEIHSNIFNETDEIAFNGNNQNEIADFITHTFSSKKIIGFKSQGKVDTFVIKNLIGFYLR